MLKMVKGSIIQDAYKLNEEYEVRKEGIIANINEDKISKVIDDFIEIQEGYLFLIIEVPTSAENEDRKGEAIHKDVYYKDGITKEEIRPTSFNDFKEEYPGTYLYAKWNLIN